MNESRKNTGLKDSDSLEHLSNNTEDYVETEDVSVKKHTKSVDKHVRSLDESNPASIETNVNVKESAKFRKQKLVSDSFDRPHVDRDATIVEDNTDIGTNMSEQGKDVKNLRAVTEAKKSSRASSSPGSKALESYTNSSGPNKSPSYVRKPLPINEPKPVLPKSKHLKVESISPSSSVVVMRASVIEEENSSGESIERKKCSSLSKGHSSSGEAVLRNASDRPSISESIDETSKKPSVQNKKNCPLSPRLTRNRPSTLKLERRERVKRVSAVSATPSTDSSKSSKTFEFVEYDADTRERILQAAIKVEDEFLEFVESLNIKPDPIIEAGNIRDKKKGQLQNGKTFSDTNSLKPPTPITSGLMDEILFLNNLCNLVGQDNLDSLCRMMEEILILRDENNKLREHLQYMEVRKLSYNVS